MGVRGRAEPSLKSRTASKAALFGWSALVSLGLTDEKKMRALGKWENKPLKWIVLKEENFGCLVISEDRIGKYKFDESNKNSWGSSSLRKFLNKDFFDSAFTDEEKRR